MSSPRPRQRFRPCNRSLDTTAVYIWFVVVVLLVSAALRRVLVTKSLLPLQSFIGHNYCIWYVVVVLLMSAALRSPCDRLPFTICVCVFSSLPFWTSSSLDVPAGVTQEEGHTGFLIRLPSAVRALIFVARRIQPFLSLVDREVEFCVLTN